MLSITENRRSQSKLAQIYNALYSVYHKFSFQDIEKIISKQGNINCRIPSHSFIKSSEPALAGGTALHIALIRRNSQVVDALLHVGADYTIKNEDGSTPLHYIATSDFHSLSDTEKLQIKPFVDVILSAHVESKNSTNPRNCDGLSHLHIACMANHIDAVKLFLENGEDVNQIVNTNATCNPGYTPLHFAVRCYDIEAVRTLLDHGANILSKDSKGMSPLHLLLELKLHIYDSIDKDVEDEFSATQNEAIKVNEDITNLLLEKIPHNKLIIDDTGLSRFHIACTSQDSSIAECILENVDNIDHTVSANSQTWPGFTGLHFAAHCNVNTVKMLLTRGADLEVKDARGVSPFDICLRRCKVSDIHAIVSQKQEWKDILLSDGKIRLSDLLFAMTSLNRLKSLLQSDLVYINAYIPESSKLWPGFTPLHLAVTLSERHKSSEPDLDLVRECLTDGADVTIKDSRGWTPLNLAFRQNKMRVVDLLLRCHHVLANPVDEDNLSHLHIACEAQNEILVENLLIRIGDVSVVYKGTVAVRSIKPGHTPLHIAVVKKNLKIMEILMRHGADVNFADFEGRTPIHETFYLHDSKSIVELLFSSSTVQDRVANGLSHLHVASTNNDVEAVERLLQLGAEIDGAITSDGKYKGCTGLHVAVMSHAFDVVVCLLRRGADILVKSDDGSTPLSRALDYKNRNCFHHFVSILRGDEDLQARVERETGMTMLHVACHYVDADEVKSLLGKGANVNARIKEDSTVWAGCTPLHAISLKKIECVYLFNEKTEKNIAIVTETLLEAGADFTLTNVEGDSPVHVCSKMGNYDTGYSRVGQMMRYHKYFSVNPVSSRGLSHFHLACMVNDVRAVEKFLQQHADVNEPIDFYAEQNPGCTPIHLAVKARPNRLFGSATQLETVHLLLRYGADVRAENSHGYTALHNAARAAPDVRLRILERILSAGADINSLSMYGETPFEILLSREEISAKEIRFFMDHNARVNSHNANSDRGYLSMLLSRKYRNVVEQRITFEEIMKTPNIAVVDETGRTAMHNVVTIANPSFSTEDYVRVIERLTKLGCDVDGQDKSGRTPLHLSAQFGNQEGTLALLTFGADANIVDASEKTALSYATEVCRKCVRTPTHRHTDVIQTLSLHLHKLQLLELDVSPLNASLKRAACPRVDVDDEFREQVDVARRLEIAETSLAVGDFLSETRAVIDYTYMSLKERDAIDEFFKSMENRGMEQLKGILMMQYRKAVTRLRMMEFAVAALRSLLGFPLPELCCEAIFKFLRNVDLKNLIESADDDA